MFYNGDNMETIINEIVNNWSKRIPSGIVDLQNEDHKYQLLGVLNEMFGESQIVEEILRNIYDNQ